MPSTSARPDKPLFVRLPSTEADRLDRAAFETGVSKRELVTRMVQRYLDSGRVPPPEPQPDPLPAAGGVELRVGRHAFYPAPAAEVLTLEQAAELLQVLPKALAKLAAAGKAPGRRIGEEWRFSRAALIAWLAG